MKILVTGCAGFIGSTLAAKLLGEGRDVIGVDCFTDYYDRWIKERNLEPLLPRKNFRFIEQDVATLDVRSILERGDAIAHEAAQAGVRASWGSNFQTYTHHNITATQSLLESVKDLGLSRFVLAGSSSVYGDALRLPTFEDDTPQPISPYGVTKLASEHLCRLYHKNYGVPAVVLRYFTVYGPKQRPDMAFHKWCKAALADEPLPLFGDGEQTRDFTFVDDAVAATAAALEAPNVEGEIINVGGGRRITVNGVLGVLESIHGRPIKRTDKGRQKGDVRHTGADVSKAERLLGFSPKVSLEDGLRLEYAHMKKLYGF
ncbi:MAG: NAD-dependent epimerase/dehydratase family protein [Deltaproteobacteria bacterium]|nr:NAD-dependent epimerase/dehydratase family protein [Deltaproteobacteria bacterium]